MKFSKLTVQQVKKSNSLLLTRIIIAAFLVITVNTTVNAQTVTVNTALDENNGVTTSIANLIATPGGAGISLREAIIAANNTAGANTILFNAALDGMPITLTIAGANENNAATGDLDITDALTITGNGPANTIVQAGTTNANGIDKVFSINPSFTLAFATNITGITIRFGRNPSGYSGDGFGGGLDWEGSGTGTLVINNCVITDNKTTDGDGGGLTVTNTGGGSGSVTITNSTISNNTPARAAAASPIGGGIFVGTTTAIFLTNCTISGNSVAGSAGQGQGGGIFIFGPGGTAGQSSLTNCIISNNTSPSDGGGIYSTTPLTINATTFSGNNSGRFGGGLFINHSNATTTISKNTFINNNATTRGGGIYLGTSTTSNILNVSYSRFAGNTSAAQNGVAIADGAATLQNNWWGCNLGPSTAACNQAAVFGTGSINFTPWLVFNQTASPASICIGATSTLTASFLLNSSGGAVLASNLDVLIGQPVTFNTPVNGTLSAAQTTIQAAGTATVTFTATGAGAGSANAVFVPLVENFTVTTSPTITVNPTPTTPGITAGGPTTFCSPGSVTLTSSSATGNQWYLNGNPIGGATNPTFVATASGNYTVVVTALGCPSAPSAGTSITASCGLSINDVTQIEGNAGTTTFQFTVSLSAPAPAGSVTFDITTADNTATDANNDYEINTLIGQSIPAGSSSTTFNVTVNGDATVEPDETFFVNITNVVGATVTDGQGQGTITNDDCAPGSQIFNYTGGVQDFVVPTGITFLTVAATGADGGDNPPSAFGGSGGVINATFPVLPGDNIRVIVGEAGKNTFYGSGGGGTGVINCGNPANCATGTLLVVAGGGGGGAFGSNLGGGASSIAGSGSGGNSIGGVGGGGGVNSPGSEGGGQASKTSISAGGIGISIGGKGFGGGGGTQIPPGGGGGGGGYTGGNGTAISGSGGSNFVDVTAVSGFTNNGGITGGSGGNNTNGVVTLSYSCNVCPTIPNISSTSSPVCQNSNITLNATGLTGMSSTYGIEFKYFAAPTADPYTGGTTIATITNGSLSGGGTTASTTTSFATAGTYYIYAILSPVPGDAGCRPSATTTVVVDLAATLNAGPDQTICSSTTQVQLAAVLGGAATNGVWDINPPFGSFSPTDTDPNALYTPTLAERTAGSVVMTYQTNDPAGVCPQAVDQMTIFIQPAATVNAGSDYSVCQSATVFPALNGTIGGAATSGTWSGGTGIFSPDVNTLNATYTPSPAELAAAPTTIILTLTTNDPAGICGAVSDQVQISIDLAATLNAGPDQTICSSTTQVQLAAVLGGAATNGVWSINPPNGSFSPSDTDPNALYTPTLAERTAGSVVMTYQTNDPAGVCPQAVDQMTIFIQPAATVNAGGDYSVCQSATVFPALNGSIGGAATTGTWSGGTGTFSPNVNTLNATYTPSPAELAAAPTTIILTLTTNDPAGICGAVSDQVQISIDLAATLNAGPDQTICSSTTQVQLAAIMGGAATNGVWSINPPNGSFSPTDTDPNALYTPTLAERTAGSVVMTYQTNDPAGVCPQAVDQMTIFIQPAATANAGSDIFICQSATVFPQLNGTIGGATTSGTWSGGTGTFSPNTNTLNATYTPSPAELAAAPATVNLTLTTNDPAGVCGAASDQVQIFIGQAATLNAGPDQTICTTTAQVQLAAVLGGAATNGVWSINPPNGSFSPSDTDPNALYTPTAGERTAGIVVMTYQTNDPAGACPQAIDQMTIFISPLPNLFTVTGGGVYCNGGNPNAVGLSGSQTGVNYQLFAGASPVGGLVSGTGSALNFGPQGTVGTYTVVASNAGCTRTMTGSVNVSTMICAPSITDPCTCLNNATTLSNGQFSETIQVNAPAGQTWTVTAVTGLYTMASPAPPAAPIPVTVGTVMTESPAGVYTLAGKHIDAVGYTISVSNGLGTTLSIGNTCAYPNPSITGLPATICPNSTPITLTGNPGDANIVSQSFTVDGVPATTFTPSVPGNHTIVYTVNGGAPKASGPLDPGCIQSVSQTVLVHPIVAGTITGPVNASICAGQSSSVNINLGGAPNFTGVFNIAVSNGIGTPTPNFNFIATVNGPSAVAIPAANLTNTSTSTTIYTITWVSLADANGCPVASLTGSSTIVVYPTPTVAVTGGSATDVCPGNAIVYNVTNPNLIPGSAFNWTAIGANAVVLGGANNVAFGNGAVNTTLGLSCPVNPAINPITFTFTPVGPAPLGCQGTPVTAQVNVRDVVAPTWVTSSTALNGTFNCQDAAGIAAANALFPVATDICDNDVTNINLISNNFAQSCGVGYAGIRTKIWTVTDACGNTSAQFVQTITIVDNAAPTWTTTAGSLNRTVDCGDVAALAAANALIPAATDNCDVTLAPVKVNGIFAVGACPNAGFYTNTFTVTDDCGNTSTTFTQVITVTDLSSPILNSPAAQTLDVGAGAGCAVPLPDYRGLITPIDCGPVTLTQSPAIGTTVLGAGGSLTVTITATDGCGNSSTRNITINLVDATAPVARCHNITVNLSAAGAASIVPSQIDGNGAGPTFNPKSSDNCGLATFNAGLTFQGPNIAPNTNILRNYNCTNLGANPITLIVTDASGNQSTCNATVTVVDVTVPAITCPANQVVAKSATCTSILPDFRALVVATDACGPVSIAQSPAAGTIIAADVANLAIIMTASDGSGNSSTCTFNVQFVDQTAPVISGCPSNISVTTGVGNTDCQIAVNWTAPTASDNCSPILGTITLTSTHAPGQQFFVGTTTVTYTATDPAGNSSTCSFTVTVTDNTIPTIYCITPGNKVVNAVSAGCTYTHSGGNNWDAAGSDNCIPLLAATYTLSGATTGTGNSLDGKVFNYGVTTVTWRVVDQFTNSTTCSFTVTVADTQVPTITCPATVNVNTNVAGCSASVPAALTAPVTTGDNCGIVLTEWSVSGASPISSGLGNLGTHIFNIGTSLVTYRVSDAAGNSTICSFNVFVTNAVAGAISGTATAAQNAMTTSTVTFTGSGGLAPYTFTYNINGGGTQTVSTSGSSNITTVAQSNAVLGTFTYTLLSVTDANACPGAINPPNTAVITVATGTPDLTSSQFFTTTQITAGGVIDEVIAVRNVGTVATSAPIVFNITNYAPITGLTVTSSTNATLTIGFTTYTLDNLNWSFNAGTGNFTSNAGIFINAGQTKYLGVRITRGSSPAQGANGSVNHTLTIPGGTGGGETPPNNNSISNTLLKN